MAGGTFDINQEKIRPGSYINYKSRKKKTISTSTRGKVVIPLVGYDWGPSGEFIKLTLDSPDAEYAKFGRSVLSGEEETLPILLAFENASEVYVYIISGGKKSKKTQGTLTIEAKYPGTRGNDITVISTANLDGGFDVMVYLDGELMETFSGCSTIAELVDEGSEYVTFSGEGDLTAFAGAALDGGENSNAINQDFTAFLDKVEKVKCNTVLIPVTDSALVNAAASKVKYLRNNVGKTVQFVFPNFAGDHIGIINVTNAFVFDGIELTDAQAAAWVAGVTAGADKTTSNTYRVVNHASSVLREKSNEEAEAAILAGEFFFSTSDDTGEVIVEYDINSLVHPSKDQDKSYRKNRVIRTFDSFADDLKATIKPAEYDNEPNGWDKMDQLGRLLLKRYSNVDGGDGAIKNVDADNDFAVDRTLSSDDNTYFNVALQPVDSSEKQYYSISTQ